MSRIVFEILVSATLLTACAPAVPPIGPGHPPTPPNTLPIETRVMALEDARQQAPFHLFVPTYLPNGFRLGSVVRRDIPLAIPPDTRFYLDYIGPTPPGQTSVAFIFINEQYWPPQPPIPIPPTPFGLTPPPKVTVHGMNVFVDKNIFAPEHPDERYWALHWAEQNVFLDLGGSLTLDELVAIAESLK